MLLLPAFTFAGCSKDENEPQTENSNDSGSNEDNNNQEPETPGNGKTLIAYFSRWGNTNYPDNVDASTPLNPKHECNPVSKNSSLL